MASAVDILAGHFGIPVGKLSVLPGTEIAEAMEELRFCRKCKAAVYIAVDAKGDSATLAGQFERQEQRQREPWRVQYQHAVEERKEFLRQTNQQHQRLFLELAKAKVLSAEDVLIGQYVLFSGEAGWRFFGGVLLNKRGVDRVRAHNFFVADSVEGSEAFLAANGDLLATLPVPLFPANAEFSALNTALLFEYRAFLGVGGPAGGGHPSKYESTFFVLSGPAANPAGGAFLPVSQLGDGTFGVNTTALEEWVIARTQGRGRGRGGRGRGRAGAGRREGLRGGRQDYEEHAEEQRPQESASQLQNQTVIYGNPVQARNEASPGRGGTAPGRGRGRIF